MSGTDYLKEAEAYLTEVASEVQVISISPTVARELAGLLGSITCGLQCDKNGMRSPYCSGCGDSTYDHDCPPRVACEHTAPFRYALNIAGHINATKDAVKP